MALTQAAYYANWNHPRIGVRSVLRNPVARELLRSLRESTLVLRAGDHLSEAERLALRSLVRIDLVSAYELGGGLRYRARRVGVYARELLEEGAWEGDGPKEQVANPVL